jgi:hypothetical protein
VTSVTFCSVTLSRSEILAASMRGWPSFSSVQTPQVVQPVGSFSSFSVKAVSTDTQTKSMSGNLPSLRGT